MKIAFVIHEMTGGGAERVISVLANYMVEMGMEVSILMTAGNKVEYRLDSRVNTVQVGGKTRKNPVNLAKRIIGLRRNFIKNSYDAIIAFQADTGLYSMMANALLGNRLFVSERNDPGKYKHKFLRWLTYSKAEHVIFQTEQARNYFTGRIKEKGMVIPNPIKDDLPDVYLGERLKRIVAVGRLEPQKNYQLLINAFDIFHENHQEYELYVYGKGYLKDELQVLVDSRSLSGYVHFEGFKDNVANEIRDAAMYIMSSDYEGMPNALMEAMAMGLPVISTDCPIGGPSELIDNMQNGLLVRCGDSSELARAIELLADDHELACKLGKNAMLVREKYDTKNICNEWIKAIE